MLTNRRERPPTPPLQPIVGTNYSQSSGQNGANRRNALVKTTIAEALKIETS